MTSVTQDLCRFSTICTQALPSKAYLCPKAVCDMKTASLETRLGLRSGKHRGRGGSRALVMRKGGLGASSQITGCPHWAQN